MITSIPLGQAHRYLALVCALFAGATLLPAQPASTGTVSGRVSDAGSGRSLQGAVVKATGTTAFDYTDAEGRFTLSGVPAGTTAIEVEYVGLDLF